MTHSLNLLEYTFLVKKALFQSLGSLPAVGLTDDFYYRVDMHREVEKITDVGFRLPRKFHTQISDHMSLGSILEALPEGKGLFRLGWFTDWAAICRYIGSWKREQEAVMVTRIRKQDLDCLPGILICEDLDVRHYPMMGYPAVLTYTIESLRSPNQNLSQTILPFTMTEFLRDGTTWIRAN